MIPTRPATTDVQRRASDSAPNPRRESVRKVDVIGIGVQKAATSWLFRCLIEHPQIRPALRNGKPHKEINFFNHTYEKGYHWYHRQFRTGKWKNVDFSVLYFPDRNVPARIHKYNPYVKLLLSVRDPVERAWSQHRHQIARMNLPRELWNFWKALEQNPCYLEQGMYATHLERWLRYFSPHQIYVVEHGRVRKNPHGVLRGVFEFLEVDPTYRPESLERRVYVSTVPAREGLQRVARGSSKLLGSVLGAGARKRIRNMRSVRRLRRMNKVDLKKIVFAKKEDRARLIPVFRSEIEEFERLVEMDLSHWKA